MALLRRHIEHLCPGIAGAWEPRSVLADALREAAEGASVARAHDPGPLPAALGVAPARVCFLTALLMAIALTFHSLLEMSLYLKSIHTQ